MEAGGPGTTNNKHTNPEHHAHGLGAIERCGLFWTVGTVGVFVFGGSIEIGAFAQAQAGYVQSLCSLDRSVCLRFCFLLLSLLLFLLLYLNFILLLLILMMDGCCVFFSSNVSLS